MKIIAIIAITIGIILGVISLIQQDYGWFAANGWMALYWARELTLRR